MEDCCRAPKAMKLTDKTARVVELAKRSQADDGRQAGHRPDAGGDRVRNDGRRRLDIGCGRQAEGHAQRSDDSHHRPHGRGSPARSLRLERQGRDHRRDGHVDAVAEREADRLRSEQGAHPLHTPPRRSHLFRRGDERRAHAQRACTDARLDAHEGPKPEGRFPGQGRRRRRTQAPSKDDRLPRPKAPRQGCGPGQQAAPGQGRSIIGRRYYAGEALTRTVRRMPSST